MAIKILLVDDMAFVKFLEKNILEEAGYTIVGEASDGEEAVKKFKELEPDIVILDISMPKMNGIEALKKMMAINPNAKIIICSAMGQSRYIKEAIELGAVDFIVKPFKKERLIGAIKKALEQ
jgi:two-component system chemotaxis response regulator CheY